MKNNRAIKRNTIIALTAFMLLGYQNCSKTHFEELSSVAPGLNEPNSVDNRGPSSSEEDSTTSVVVETNPACSPESVSSSVPPVVETQVINNPDGSITTITTTTTINSTDTSCVAYIEKMNALNMSYDFVCSNRLYPSTFKQTVQTAKQIDIILFNAQTKIACRIYDVKSRMLSGSKSEFNMSKECPSLPVGEYTIGVIAKNYVGSMSNNTSTTKLRVRNTLLAM